MKVVMKDDLDNYKEEDIVKNVWPGMYVFLTRRHGVNGGTISLENDAVNITWSYEDDYDDVYKYDEYGVTIEH